MYEKSEPQRRLSEENLKQNVIIGLNKPIEEATLDNLNELFSSMPRQCKFKKNLAYPVHDDLSIELSGKDILRFESAEGSVSYHVVEKLTLNNASYNHKILKSDFAFTLDPTQSKYLPLENNFIIKVFICKEKNNQGAEIARDEAVKNEVAHFDAIHNTKCLVLKRKNHNGFFKSYVLMPKLGDIDLSEYIINELNAPHITFLNLIDVAIAVTKALQQVHDRKRVHGDNKPQNIRVDRKTGVAYYVDVQHTKLVEQKNDLKTCGTLEYLTVDAALKKSSQATDIQSHAAILAEIFRATDCVDERYRFRAVIKKEESPLKREALYLECAKLPFDFPQLFQGLNAHQQALAAKYRSRVLELLFYMQQNPSSDVPPINEVLKILESIKNDVVNEPALANALPLETAEEVHQREDLNKDINGLIITEIKQHPEILSYYARTREAILKIQTKYGSEVDLIDKLELLRSNFVKTSPKGQMQVQGFLSDFINEIMQNEIVASSLKARNKLLKPLLKMFAADSSYVHVINEFKPVDLLLLEKLFKSDSNVEKYKAFTKDGDGSKIPNIYEVKLCKQTVKFQLKNDIYRSIRFDKKEVFRIVNEKVPVQDVENSHPSKLTIKPRSRMGRSDKCLIYDGKGHLLLSSKKSIAKKSKKPDLKELKAQLIRESRKEKELPKLIAEKLENEKELFKNNIKIHRKVYGKVSCDNLFTRHKNGIESNHIIFEDVIEGTDVYHKIRTELKNMNEKQRIALIRRLIAGVKKFIHDKGIIHGDPQPGNFIDNGFIVKPVDFEGSTQFNGEDTEPLGATSASYAPFEFLFKKISERDESTDKDDEGNTIFTTKWDIPGVAGIILEILGADHFYFDKLKKKIGPDLYMDRPPKDSCQIPYNFQHIFSNLGFKPEHRFQIIQFLKYMTQNDVKDRADIYETMMFFDRINDEMDESVNPLDNDKNDESNRKMLRLVGSEKQLFKVYQLTQQTIDRIYLHGLEIEREDGKESKAKDIYDFARKLHTKRVEFMNIQEKTPQDMHHFLTDFIKTIRDESQNKEHLDKSRSAFTVILYNLLGLLLAGIPNLIKLGYGLYYKTETFFQPKTKTRVIAEEENEVLEKFAKTIPAA